MKGGGKSKGEDFDKIEEKKESERGMVEETGPSKP